MPQTFDPNDWLLSTTRSLKDYLENRFSSVAGGHGLEAFEIVMEFPAANELPKPAEFTKTIIHFEIDDIMTTKLGMGTDIVDSTIVDGTVDVAGSVTDHQAQQHVINFDVGIWASDESGGLVARLRAYQYLNQFLSGEIAKRKCEAYTEGVEIRHYTSGRFIKETISDVRVFRVVGAELEVRVFSRDDADPDILVDQEPTQQPELVITGDDGSLVNLT